MNLIYSLLHAVKTLVSSDPSNLDTQKILPPIITLLAAYLALLSFYRTASWAIRTTLWFAKWGAILSVITAGTGWYLGNMHANGENGVGGLLNGVLPAAGGMLLNVLNGQDQDAAGSLGSTRARSPRPKAWESWDKHQEWQYHDNARDEDHGAEGDLQQVFREVIGVVGRTVNEGSWWEAAKGAVDEISRGRQGRETRAERRAQAKAGAR
ncbi:hypothetical protein WOLCODRAFT_122810 [Wolfiporia cocos MD-104 SS10]|uniref:Uncharacterized protein n=1 Tax=Wolfiporia cocos (strain MD-104) TaxID=742152 RepID=A0A2H3JVA1_WOLCO|nr:hypothetical protein WOLCODRAFT_122810 [Wolfiporia cocos MD-104 SS10]